MLPIQTPYSNAVFVLVGGDESNNLPVEINVDEENKPVLVTEWGLTDAERKVVAEGGFIRLVLWGEGHPPVAMGVVDELHRIVSHEGVVQDEAVESDSVEDPS